MPVDSHIHTPASVDQHTDISHGLVDLCMYTPPHGALFSPPNNSRCNEYCYYRKFELRFLLGKLDEEISDKANMTQTVRGPAPIQLVSLVT